MRGGATRAHAREAARDSVHDFRRDGSRTIRRARLLGWALWLEESASWHVSSSATYGVALWRAPGWLSIELAAGRYSVHAARSGRP